MVRLCIVSFRGSSHYIEMATSMRGLCAADVGCHLTTVGGIRIMMQCGPNQRRTGAVVLADMLAGYGVTHVFMVPAVLRRTFAEMERRTKIARVHCHGEKSAAYMA